jgi:hypothetical protein
VDRCIFGGGSAADVAMVNQDAGVPFTEVFEAIEMRPLRGATDLALNSLKLTCQASRNMHWHGPVSAVPLFTSWVATPPRLCDTTLASRRDLKLTRLHSQTWSPDPGKGLAGSTTQRHGDSPPWRARCGPGRGPASGEIPVPCVHSRH